MAETKSSDGGTIMTLQSASQRALVQYVESLERLEDEKKATMDDIKDKFAELKGAGFCAKTIKKILKMRKKSKDERDEEQAILDTYMHALNMIDQPDMFEPMAEAAE
jgi:uncharacterized protein (UPF0335 family)